MWWLHLFRFADSLLAFLQRCQSFSHVLRATFCRLCLINHTLHPTLHDRRLHNQHRQSSCCHSSSRQRRSRQVRQRWHQRRPFKRNSTPPATRRGSYPVENLPRMCTQPHSNKYSLSVCRTMPWYMHAIRIDWKGDLLRGSLPGSALPPSKTAAPALLGGSAEPKLCSGFKAGRSEVRGYSSAFPLYPTLPSLLPPQG